MVDVVETPLDIPLAHKERRLVVFRETTSAIERARPMTQMAVPAGDHLAVMGADRLILVQRQDDFGLGRGALHDLKRLHAEIGVVMEMDEIRRELVDKALQRAGKIWIA